MSALEEVEMLKQKAIALLLTEQQQIEDQLTRLGYGQENAPSGKRRGRRPKGVIEQEALALDASHS